MIPWLKADDPFPDVSNALDATTGFPGLLAAGADLSPERLIKAYRHGIFPWFSEGQPILWWSTDPRMVLPTSQFVISRSLKKKLKQIHKSIHSDGRWKLTFDTGFRPGHSGMCRTETACRWYMDYGRNHTELFGLA